MKRALAFLFCATVIQAQGVSTDLPKGFVAYKRLTKSDFKIETSGKAGPTMSTTPFLFHRYRYVWTQELGSFRTWVTEWKILSGFIAERTRRIKTFADSVEGIPHEQGHLDLNEIYARQLAATNLSDLPTGEGISREAAIKDLETKLQTLVDSTVAKCTAEQNDYDLKTNHGMDKVAQKREIAPINARLSVYGAKQ